MPNPPVFLPELRLHARESTKGGEAGTIRGRASRREVWVVPRGPKLDRAPRCPNTREGAAGRQMGPGRGDAGNRGEDKATLVVNSRRSLAERRRAARRRRRGIARRTHGS